MMIVIATLSLRNLRSSFFFNFFWINFICTLHYTTFDYATFDGTTLRCAATVNYTALSNTILGRNTLDCTLFNYLWLFLILLGSVIILLLILFIVV